ncbi:hypothetical protein [Aromatoleum petrolei]
MRVGWGVDANGPLRCRGNLHVGRDLYCNDAADFTGNAFAGGNLVVHGAITCAKSLRAGFDIAGDQDINAAQGIEAGGGIHCGRHLEAGWGIRAGDAILADGSIRAGESILAGEEIRAGKGHGIFAGLSIPIDAWESCAKVKAKNLPVRLMSGWWEGQDSPLTTP